MQKYLEKISKWLIYGVTLIPIIASDDFIFPFVFLKSIYFRLIVILLGVIIAWLVLERKEIWGRRNVIFWAWIIFVASQIAAGIFGVDAYRSFWGNFERMEGVWHYLLLSIYFFALINIFRSKIEWIKFLRMMLLGASAVVLLGLIKNGIAMSNNNWSSIGNAAFLGSFMMLGFLLVGFLFLLDENKKWRIVYAVAGAVDALILLGAASRAPIIALILGLLAGGIFYFKNFNKKIKIIFFGVILLGVAGGAVLLSQKESAWVQKVNFLRRLSQISFNDETTSNRLLVWKGGWLAFKDRPILGYGPENFSYGLNKYFQPEISENWFDRAHNIVVDLLVSSGIIGLVTYGLILFVILKYIWRLKEKEKKMAAWFFVFWFSIAAVQMLVFLTLSCYLLLITILAFLNFIWEQNFSEENNIKINYFVAVKLEYAFLGAIILLAIFAINSVVIKPWMSNMAVANGIRYAVADVRLALEYYDKAISNKSLGSREAILQLGRYAIDSVEYPEIDEVNREKIFERAESEMQKLVVGNPDDFQATLLLGEIYVSHAQFKSYYTLKALELLKNGLIKSPGHINTYLLIAQTYWLMDDVPQAIWYLEKAYSLNSIDKKIHENLMNLYAQISEKEKLIRIGDEYLLKYHNLSSEKYRKMGGYYYQADLVAEAEKILLEYAIPAEPSYWKNYVSLASIYEGEGDKIKAAEFLELTLSEQKWPADIVAGIREYIDNLKNNLAGERLIIN